MARLVRASSLALTVALALPAASALLKYLPISPPQMLRAERVETIIAVDTSNESAVSDTASDTAI